MRLTIKGGLIYFYMSFSKGLDQLCPTQLAY